MQIYKLGNNMLDNLIFSLNATLPIFIMMVIGYLLKRFKMLDEYTTAKLNKLVFRIFLPALIFMDMAGQDFVSMWDTSFVIFCAAATSVSILLTAFMSLFIKEKADRGEFIQASYRSAAATLGIAFMTNIYDSAAMVALMILGSVPIYNIVAVLILSLTAPLEDSEAGEKGGLQKKNSLLKKTVLNLVTNPIILSILAGFIFSLLKLPRPFIFAKSVTYLGNVASPLALIALGATFEFRDVKEKLGSVVWVNVNKLLLFCLLFLPLAILMGFRDEKLVAALIMLGSATTSSSFIMAKNMGHKGTLTSCAVMTTTLFASFSLTLWLFLLRTFGFI